MGILSLVSLGLTAASTVVQINQANRANRARRRANAIQSANEQYQDKLARRRAAKERRIRRGRILSLSTNLGTPESSGELGSMSALQANFGTAISQQSAGTKTTLGVNSALQAAANAQYKGQRAGAFSDLFNQGVDFYTGYQEFKGLK